MTVKGSNRQDVGGEGQRGIEESDLNTLEDDACLSPKKKYGSGWVRTKASRQQSPKGLLSPCTSQSGQTVVDAPPRGTLSLEGVRV